MGNDDPSGMRKRLNVCKNWHMTKAWVVRLLAFVRLIEKSDPVANKADDRHCLNGGSDQGLAGSRDQKSRVKDISQQVCKCIRSA